MEGKMNRNDKRCVNFGTILVSATILGAMLTVGGCGGGGSSPGAVSQSNTIPAFGTPNGVTQTGTGITTPAAITGKTSTGATAITIPAGVTITPPATAAAFNAATPPTIGVTTYNSVAALPATKTGAVFATVAGSVGVEFDYPIGTVVPSPVTFTGGSATITIPLTNAVASCSVFVNKNDGNGYVAVAPAQVLTCTPTSATVSVTSLCTFVVNPIVTSGSTGGTGSGGF
jgi:hypothetical protein